MKKLPIVAAAIILLAGVSPAVSDAATPPRKGEAKTKKKATPKGPGIVYERFRRAVQVEVEEKREEQIAGLLRLLELGPPTEEVPDLRFRVAELYSDKARAYFFRGQEQDDAIAAAETEGAKAPLLARKKAALEESREWANQATEAYAQIRAEHSDYARMPEVLFALGQSYWTAGKFKGALEPYADLIRRFPNSPLVAEAWIAFGEYYFNDGDVQKALSSYQKAAENKRSRVYGFALYKQAWCYFNMAEWKKALRKFEATVLFSQLSEEMSGENKIALGREAQADWVRTYVHVGNEDRARFEIAQLLDLESCTGRCLKLLEGLAGLWFEEGYFDRAKGLYLQLVRLEPEGLKNPLRMAKVVDLVDRSGDKKRTVGQAKRLAEVYVTARRRFGALAPDSDEAANAAVDLEEADIVAETNLRRLAQEWNKEGRKTRRTETLAQAEKMYAYHLELFPEAKEAYNLRFQYADLLFKLERFDAAAKEYEKVVEAKPKAGKHLVAAANDNILALDEHLRDLDLELPSSLEEKTELHPQHQRLADACRRYLRFVPEEADESADKRPAVKLKLARVLYGYNDFEPALEMFDALVKSHPRSEQAVVAANLVVDVHNLRKDWPSLYDAARRYVDDPDLVRGRPELKAQLSRYGEYAKFALIQKLKEDVEADGGDLTAVARGFEEFHREFPKSENADQALFNASVLYDKLGQKERANGLRQRLLAEYSGSELRSDVAFYLAKQHEQRTEFGRAAAAYRSFAREFPKDPRARDALYDASVFYAGTGQARTAVKVREEYLATYSRKRRARRETAAVEFAIARDLERGRRLGDAARAYAAFAKRHALDPLAFDAMWNEARIQRRLRRIGTAEKVEGRILGTVLWMKKKGRRVPANARRYASLVAYSRLDERFEKYRKSRLPTPNLRNPRPFQRALKQLARDRDGVIRRYEAIIKSYKQAEASIAALYRIARAWDIFGRAITKVRCPRGAGREVCDVLRNRMEELSLPARDSAVEAYQACVDRAAALETFTEHAGRCARRLEAVAPAEAPPVLEKIAAPRPAPRLTGLEPSVLILKRPNPSPPQTASREVTP